MIAIIDPEVTVIEPESPVSNRRMLKNYRNQIKRIKRDKLFSLYGMKQKNFEAQAEKLGQRLAQMEPIRGYILIVTCLPYGKLLPRMEKMSCGHHKGICACNVNDIETEELPNTLYAMLGVDDGRDRRLFSTEKIEIDAEFIEGIVEPQNPLTAWGAIDLAFHYPNVLKQQGLIIGTTLRESATALWLQNGQPVFGSTNGKRFETCCKGIRWGVPSFKALVTP